jgi:hypothetical protein
MVDGYRALAVACLQACTESVPGPSRCRRCGQREPAHPRGDAACKSQIAIAGSVGGGLVAQPTTYRLVILLSRDRRDPFDATCLSHPHHINLHSVRSDFFVVR